MALVLPFKAVRPQPQFVSQVAALPYDVMTREEAQKAVSGNALSFMHVEKSEIDVPDRTKSDDVDLPDGKDVTLFKCREKESFCRMNRLAFIYTSSKWEPGTNRNCRLDERRRIRCRKNQKT